MTCVFISINLTLDPRFHEMLEFRMDEMRQLILLVEVIKEPVETLQKMKRYYDGYEAVTWGKRMILEYLKDVFSNCFYMDWKSQRKQFFYTTIIVWVFLKKLSYLQALF